MTEKLLLVLINVLIISFLNDEVSQGGVATRVRCDAIDSDNLVK